MGPPFLAFIFFLWVLGAAVGGIYDAQSLATSDINTVAQFQIFREYDVDLPFIEALSFPMPNPEYFAAVGSLLIWNSSLWEGWAIFLRLFFMLALSFAFILPLLMAFFSAKLTKI